METTRTALGPITRAQHLAWCKERALAYVDRGDVSDAFDSFCSDVSKHPDTEPIMETIEFVGMPLLMMGLLESPKAMRDHILGYN